MKSKMLSSLATIAMASALASESINSGLRAEDFTPNKPKPKMPDGMKEWYIDGQVVYARNRKNAQRKADNLNQNSPSK